MCVIVFKPANVELKMADVEKMWSQNSDGAGLAYFTEKEGDAPSKIHVEKGFLKLLPFKRRLEELFSQYGEFSLALHFRTKTCGPCSAEMTHPFAVSKERSVAIAINPQLKYDAVLFHNGIIKDFGDKEDSDTLDFTTSILSCVEPEARERLLNMFYSKFLLMQNGRYYFCGENWEQYSGLTVSNTFWNPRHHVGYGSGYYVNGVWRGYSEYDDNRDLGYKKPKHSKKSNIIELPAAKAIAEGSVIAEGKKIAEAPKENPPKENPNPDRVIEDPVEVSKELQDYSKYYGVD